MDARARQWPSEANYEFISAAAIAAEDTTLLLLLFFRVGERRGMRFHASVSALHLHLGVSLRRGCSASPRIIVLEEIFIVARAADIGQATTAFASFVCSLYYQCA